MKPWVIENFCEKKSLDFGVDLTHNGCQPFWVSGGYTIQCCNLLWRPPPQPTFSGAWQ